MGYFEPPGGPQYPTSFATVTAGLASERGDDQRRRGADLKDRAEDVARRPAEPPPRRPLHQPAGEQAGQRGGAARVRRAPGRRPCSPAAATAQASAPTVSARSAAVVRPATRAPNPPGLAAGEEVATTTETRPVTSATTSAATASGSRGTAATAATWISSTSTSAPTPMGPMSERRMISSATSAGRRLPSPSAVSASPSRCRPPVSTAITATASAAPSSRPAPVAFSVPAASTTPPPMAPSSSPIPGSQRIARAATSSSSVPLTPAGIVVKRLSATRQAGGCRSLTVPVTAAAWRCPRCTARPARSRRRRARSAGRAHRESGCQRRWRGRRQNRPRC